MARQQVRLSLDAKIFIHKLFPDCEPEVDLKGRYLTPRALEASCELIEAGYIEIDSETSHYRLLLQKHPLLSLKLQRTRVEFESFELFRDLKEPRALQQEIQELEGLSPLIEVMGELSRIQSDLLAALRYTNVKDSVAQLHVRHAVQALKRIAEEGVRDLETVLLEPD